jgi:hypothetical protein
MVVFPPDNNADSAAPGGHREDLGLHRSTTHLAHGTIGLQEVGLQEHVEQVAGDALDGVVDGQHVDLLAILDIGTLRNKVCQASAAMDSHWYMMQGARWKTHLVHRDDIAEANAKVLPDHLVNADLGLINGVIRQHDAHGVLALLSLQQGSLA